MSSFKIDFDVDKYKHLWIDKPPIEEIINSNKTIEDAVWTKQTAPYPHKEFIELEHKRLRQGAYIYIKDELLWIPPNYYQYLQYGIVGGVSPQFRLKKLKHKYFKIDVRNNPQAIGTVTMKGRQDGETHDAMSDAWWELGDGINYHGMIGIQSKTDADAYNPCWLAVKAQWMNYPLWLKDLLYSDIINPKHMENQIRIERPNSDTQLSRSLYFKYFPSVFNAMDGKTNVLRCIDDEFAKWKNFSFIETFINQKKFILNGVERRGLFDVFSSASDTNGRHNEEAAAFFEAADPTKLNEKGTTQNRMFAYHLSPLEGLQGLYDKYGDADPNECYDHIINERKTVPADKKMAEVRAYAINKKELFESYDKAGSNWSNHEGIVERKTFVSRSIYKDEVTLEPKNIWGNIEWTGGIKGNKPYFRPNKENAFNIITGRFCFSELPKFYTELRDIKRPPKFSESVIGFDPYHKKNTEREGSTAGIVVYKFRDLINADYEPRPIMIYNCRPSHPHIVYEDIIKIAIFTRSPIQYEGTSDAMEIYLEEEGFDEWIMFKVGSKKLKGDAPRGQNGGRMMRNIIEFIDTLTNLPLDENMPYFLNNFWFEELLKEIEEFDESDTQKFNLFMAFAQSVLGALKLSKTTKKTGDKQYKDMLDYILS